MLGKLMKYEMGAMGRILLPLYGALLFMSLVMGIAVNVLHVWTLFKGIVIFLYTVVAIGSGVMTLILIVQRFYKNLLGNEGYLMFTLPVTTGKHMWSKGIIAGVWMVIATFVGFLSAGIIIASTGEFSLSLVGSAMERIWDEVGAMSLVYLLELIILIFLSVAHSVFAIYAAISIGHLWTNHRLLGAILAYMGLVVAESTLISLFGTFDLGRVTIDNMQKLSDFMGEEAAAHIFILSIALILAVLITGYYLITHYILKNKLNLE